MDPCLPGVSIEDARTIARVKLGVPPQYANKMSVAQVCKAMNLSKKTNIMPPMEYRVYMGKTYLIDPKSPLSISDFVTFLKAKSVNDIAPVARKLKLVTEYVSKSELKTNIIKILQALKIAEPIEVPHKVMKLNKGTNINANRVNANMGNANRVNANANKGSLEESRNELNLGEGGSSSLNLSRAHPSKLSLTGNSSQNSGNRLELGEVHPSKLSLTGNSSQNSGNRLELGEVRPSYVNLNMNNENRGPPLRLGTPSPSNVKLSNVDEEEHTPLRLGARSNLSLSGGSGNRDVSGQLQSLQRAVSGNRNANIANVVNEEVGKNSISKTLANLAKKVG
jgi:hypothetical protein